MHDRRVSAPRRGANNPVPATGIHLRRRSRYQAAERVRHRQIGTFAAGLIVARVRQSSAIARAGAVPSHRSRRGRETLATCAARSSAPKRMTWRSAACCRWIRSPSCRSGQYPTFHERFAVSCAGGIRSEGSARGAGAVEAPIVSELGAGDRRDDSGYLVRVGRPGRDTHIVLDDGAARREELIVSGLSASKEAAQPDGLAEARVVATLSDWSRTPAPVILAGTMPTTISLLHRGSGRPRALSALPARQTASR